jgi:Flp pilus assembly protein TadG
MTMGRRMTLRLNRPWFRRRGMGEAGVAGIELALATPMLALMLTGGFDFGRAAFEQKRLVDAARAGVQYAMQGSATWTNTAAIVAAARADANDTANNLTVTTSQCTCPTGTTLCSAGATCTGSSVTGTYVKVTVSESYATLVNYPFVTSPIALSSQAMIRVQ